MEDEDDVNTDRIGHTEWCQCGKCLPMRKGRESVCCLEIVEVKKRTGRLTCITDHDGFKSLCLDHHVVEDAIYQYVGEVGGYVDDTPAFELFRHVAYRQFVRWIWRRLGKHVRKVIPSCSVAKIRAKFPSETYTGFKLFGIDH
ncbi:P2X purinoceptor 7-like [Rhopilema esculentum]